MFDLYTFERTARLGWADGADGADREPFKMNEETADRLSANQPVTKEQMDITLALSVQNPVELISRRYWKNSIDYLRNLN